MERNFKMRKWIFAAAGVVSMVAATSASAGTLEDVRARGHLNCIVNTGLTGFASMGLFFNASSSSFA